MLRRRGFTFIELLVVISVIAILIALLLPAAPFTHEGRRGVLIVSINDARSEANLVGVDPGSGRELWRWNGWKEQWGALGVDPVIHAGKVFLTSAQEYRQFARFTIAGDTLRQDWPTNRVAS